MCLHCGILLSEGIRQGLVSWDEVSAISPMISERPNYGIEYEFMRPFWSHVTLLINIEVGSIHVSETRPQVRLGPFLFMYMYGLVMCLHIISIYAFASLKLRHDGNS